MYSLDGPSRRADWRGDASKYSESSEDSRPYPEAPPKIERAMAATTMPFNDAASPAEESRRCRCIEWGRGVPAEIFCPDFDFAVKLTAVGPSSSQALHSRFLLLIRVNPGNSRNFGAATLGSLGTW